MSTLQKQALKSANLFLDLPAAIRVRRQSMPAIRRECSKENLSERKEDRKESQSLPVSTTNASSQITKTMTTITKT